MTNQRTIRDALKGAMARLRAAEVPSHTLAAELLLMHTLGRDRAWLYAHPEAELDAGQSEQFAQLVRRRAAGEPTQYLTGKQEFWGLEIHVEPGVLIPRPETEHVVEVALERLGPPSSEDLRPRGAGLRIADAGTGSGCIAIALARELPGAEIIATDISPLALHIARGNAERLGCAQTIRFVECNLLDCFFESRNSKFDTRSRLVARDSKLDLIVSNPPYVGRDAAANLPRVVREHEPEAALFGGETGGEIYPRLIEQALGLLASGGILVLELGHDSLPQVYARLEGKAEWRDVRIAHDLAGIPRVISALRS
jgi:release factor glutamine methyltransferase